MNTDEEAAIAGVFIRLGADEDRARVMARQLIKRADQIATERGIKREEALRQLLSSSVRGRQGEPPLNRPENGGESPPSEQKN